MIRYGKGWWGTGVLTRMYGSAFPRALPFSLLATLMAVLLSIFFQELLDDQFLNPYPYQTFAFIVGFMIVFRCEPVYLFKRFESSANKLAAIWNQAPARYKYAGAVFGALSCHETRVLLLHANKKSNLSYGRYNEGRSHLATLVSKLSDATEMAINFDRMTVHPRNNHSAEEFREHQKEHDWFCNTLIHLVSLMHAVALATLRVDFNMENIVVHDSTANAPRSNIYRQMNNERIIAEEYKTSKRRNPDVVKTQRPIQTINTPAAHEGADAYDGPEVGKQPAVNPKLYTASAGRRSWRDYFILRTEPKHAQHIYRLMKLPVIGGLTQAEGLHLGAFVTSGKGVKPVPDLNLGIHGFMLENGNYAPAPTERVHTILSWLQQLIIERIANGGVTAPAPVQSRIHQVLSDAMLGYEHCKKLMDTPFPFPWAQAVNFVLMLFCFTLPFVVVAHTTGITVAACITFAAVQTHVMLNEVARDIEDPYLYDPNELPLPQMQYKLNERLIAIAHCRRPVAFTDVGHTALMPTTAAPIEEGKTPKWGSLASLPTADDTTAAGASPPPSEAPSKPLGNPPQLSFAEVALLATQNKQRSVEPAGSVMSGMSPLAPTYSNASALDRPNIHRPVVENHSDLLAFSTKNDLPAGAQHPTMRWRNNARAAAAAAAASAGVPTLGAPTDAVLPSTGLPSTPSVVSNTTPNIDAEVSVTPMAPQVVVDEDEQQLSPPPPEAHSGFYLPLGVTKDTPFDAESDASARKP